MGRGFSTWICRGRAFVRGGLSYQPVYPGWDADAGGQGDRGRTYYDPE